MLQKQPVQVAAADSRVGRDLRNIQILARIVEINKLDRALHVGIAGILAAVVVAVQHHQRREKAKQRRRHLGLVAGIRPRCGVNVIEHILHGAVLIIMEQRRFLRKSGLFDKAAGIRAVEAHPAVFPRLIVIGLVRGNHPGNHKKAVPGGKRVFSFSAVKRSFSGKNIMDQIMIADSRPPGVIGRTALQSRAVYGQTQTVLKRSAERTLELFVFHRTAPPLPE